MASDMMVARSATATTRHEDEMMLDKTQPVVAVDGFSGPFDLLVRLIERRELDLLAISLAEVTDQYLAHLSSANLRDPEHLSAFLVVAAKLLLIKSTLLLPPKERTPMPDPATPDPTDLIERLRVYRSFRAVGNALVERHDAGLRSYPHMPIAYRPTRPRRAPPLDPTLLRDAFRQALDRPKVEPETELPTEVRMTVAEAMDLLRMALDRFTTVRFSDLLGAGAPRQRYVATFLGVLELARLGVVSAHQADRFGTITLARREAPSEIDAASAAETG